MINRTAALKAANLLTAPVDAVRAVIGGAAVNPQLAGQVNDLLSQRARQQALEHIGQLAMVGLGAGAAGAGAVGLYNSFRRDRQKRKADPRLVVLPYNRPPAPPLPALPPKQAGWQDDLAAWFSGGSAGRPSEVPWYRPAATLAALGALAGGYKGVSTVIGKARQAERQRDLEAARREFHDALLAQYQTKTAAHLDRAFDQLEQLNTKRAFGGFTGEVAGGYLTYAALASLLAGMAGYHSARKRSKRTALTAAQAQRERQRLNERPAPLYAVPEPLPRPLPKADPAADLATISAV